MPFEPSPLDDDHATGNIRSLPSSDADHKERGFFHHTYRQRSLNVCVQQTSGTELGAKFTALKPAGMEFKHTRSRTESGTFLAEEQGRLLVKHNRVTFFKPVTVAHQHACLASAPFTFVWYQGKGKFRARSFQVLITQAV